MSSDTQKLIEEGARRFLDELPALKPLKLVVRLDLRAKRDAQTWRVEFPQVDVRKDPAGDEAILKLIGKVIERHETRQKIKKRRL